MSTIQVRKLLCLSYRGERVKSLVLYNMLYYGEHVKRASRNVFWCMSGRAGLGWFVPH